ncbi:MAG: betaine--homocysteine S-methyltransferase [Pseudomonadota bacterium]
MNTFLQLLNEKQVLLTDGATGTSLFGLGLQSGDSPEFWNVDFPDRVATHYRSFIDAGSDIILTNTFGGNRFRQKLHDAEDRVTELNRAAAEILGEQIKDSGRTVAAAGSMGPTGEILEPSGTLSIEGAAEAFEEQALALKAGGVDVLWIETLSSVEEAKGAVMGAAKAELPIVLTMSIDTNGRTMMGLTPADIVAMQDQLTTPLMAYGTNCGVGAADVVVAINNMRVAAATTDQSPVFIAKGNCGIPEWVDGEIAYNGTPEIMAKYSSMAIDAGARIIGGCCGTTPDHIRAMREAIDHHLLDTSEKQPPSLQDIVAELGEVTKGAQAQMLGDLSVEGGSAASSRRERRSRRR